MATSSAFTSQFPEAQFRSAIRETMKMGMPELDSEKLIWRWNRTRTYTQPDPTGHPYNLDAPTLTDLPGDSTQDPEDDGLIVDYAMQIDNPQADQATTAVGLINFNKIIVTLFDVDYAKVKTADYATVGNVRYVIEVSTPPYGLFGVTMHDVYLQAQDETT